MASAIEGKGQPPSLKQVEGTKIIYASLRLVNDAGEKSMAYLGKRYAAISEHHRTFLRVNRRELSISSASAEGAPSLAGHNLPEDEDFEGHWDLAYDTDIKNNNLTISLGIGSPDSGKDLGVDILIGCPPSSTKGVAAIHAVLQIHPDSGVLMIQGIDDDHPVQYILHNKPVFLRAGMSHALWQSVNRFFLGNLEFNLTYAELDETGQDHLREVRDKVFEWNDLQAPDARLPVLPPPEYEIDQRGNCHIFGILGFGSYGIVRIGINLPTGYPCAVKSIHVKHSLVLDEILNEASILLKYPDQTGLLQSSLVLCDHGNRFLAGQPGDVKDAFSTCRGTPDIFHFFTPFAAGGDFSTVHLDENNLCDIVKLLRGPMEGLRFLHSMGYMHRDVTCRNMFIMADGCGVLGDHGKVLLDLVAYENRTGPVHTRAPEVNGTTFYDQSADVWSFAFAIVRIFFKNVYSWVTFNKNSPQSKAWAIQATQKLHLLGRESPFHAKVVKLVTWMLTYEPYNRPTMEDILTLWPDPKPIEFEAGTVENLEENGPPAKFQKTSGITKVARQAPAPLGCVAPADLFIKKPSTDVKIVQQIQKENCEAVNNGCHGERSPATNAPQPKHNDAQGGKKQN